MTRWLLVIGLWAMLAGTAGAETDPWPGKSCVDYPAECRAVITVTTQTACEQKMQAAMEAMDRFMPTVVMYDALNLIKNPAPDTRQWLKDFLVIAENAEKEWAEAKQCWKRQ